jgi:recombination protein RecT
MANIEKRNDIKSLLTGDKFKNEVARALPKHLTPDRFIRVACTAMTKTPKLAQCTQESFFNALLSLSQLGLEPDGRRAHLIPYGNTCQLIVDYKGLVELAMRSGNVSNIHADIICENDVFEYDKGEIKVHKIDFKQPRGEMYAAYAICRFKDGTEKTEVMTRDEVEAIRKRSKAGNAGPWVTDWNEMAKKTVFRRLSKWLPLSPEQRDVLEHDADRFDPINVQYVDTPPARGVAALEGKIVEPEVVDIPKNTEETPSEPKEEADARIVGKVKAFSDKPTKREGVSKYGILIIEQDGDVETWVNTFDKKLVDSALDYKANDTTVEALARTTNYGLELESIQESK